MKGIEAMLAWDVHERRTEITGCDARLRELRRGALPESPHERDHLIAKRRSLSAEQGTDKEILRRSGVLYEARKPLPRMV